jgi:hypothetical protein
MHRIAIAGFLLLAALATPLQAQLEVQRNTLSGPRFGITVITGSLADRVREDYGIRPFMTQFGWQFETEMFRSQGGITAVGEVVPLLGALEQGKVVPSVSGLVGIRAPSGFEVAVGPNLSPAGVGLAMAVGMTFRAGEVNFPVNLAAVPSDGGVRLSLLTGFNFRD